MILSLCKQQCDFPMLSYLIFFSLCAYLFPLTSNLFYLTLQRILQNFTTLQYKDKRTNRRTDQWMDGQMDGQIDGQTYPLTLMQ